jgi:hypothetical protein
MRSQLEEELREIRRLSGIKRRAPSAVVPGVDVEGGTMGIARTDIPSLQDVPPVVGRSSRAGGTVNPNSRFAPTTDPMRLPHTHGHAEQNIADQLDTLLARVPESEMEGRRVWVLIEQEVCPTCAQGLAGGEGPGGVLRRLSEAYPRITFEIKNLNDSRILVIRNGSHPG